MPRNVAFTIEVWPLDLAWRKGVEQRQQDSSCRAPPPLLTIVVFSRPTPPGEFPDEERYDSQQRDATRNRQPDDRTRAKSRTFIRFRS